MRNGRIDVVVGGQFGSESKGRVTGELTRIRKHQGKMVVGVRVAGPNAGHVIYDEKMRRWPLRQVPVSMIVDPYAIGMIAAGSEIDPEVLWSEVESLESAGFSIRDRLMIDRQATILEPFHREQEGGNDGPLQTRMGSTGKGVGAARSDRIMRTAKVASDWPGLDRFGTVLDTQAYLDAALRSNTGYAVIIEGTQGYGLGLHAGYYPYCTSSDCRAIDFLAMAGVAPWAHEDTADYQAHIVFRAYPIRVAGNSGPLLRETSWAELGLPEERTTVTNKVRRVGNWDSGLAAAAMRANGGGVIHLAMADQKIPKLSGYEDWGDLDYETSIELSDWIAQLQAELGGSVGSIGTGPTSTLWMWPGGVL